MKIYTNTFDLSRPSPHRFWVSPYSDFKFGIKLVNAGAEVQNDFTVAAGTTELTPDEDKIDGFTIFTAKSADTGFVEYTIDVADIVQKFKLVQIVTDSTVFEVGGGGDVPADVATQTWVNSQISDFITDDALTAYATKAELTGYVENDDLTAYYTKSETSSATELADAFANAGGGAISAFDLSESPVWSKTMVENAVKTNTCLPQTIFQLEDNTLSVADIVGEFNVNDVAGTTIHNYVKKLIVGTNVSAVASTINNNNRLQEIVLPDSLAQINNNAFINGGDKYCIISIPNSVSAIANPRYNAAGATNGYRYMDFGNTRTSVPTVGTTAAVSISCKYYVPDALYDTWIAANKWSSIASQIHRHSELEAPYATSTAVSALTAANSKVTGGAETGTTGTPAAVNAVKSVYETDWATLSATADANTFYVVLPDPE